MATIFDIASYDIVGESSSGTLGGVAALDVTVSNPTLTVSITGPGDITTLEFITQGPTGAPGVQNVYVDTVPPADPEINWIWVDISP